MKFLSRRLYNFVIGAVLLYGFALNAVICIYFADVIRTWNPYKVIAVYLFLAIGGIHLSFTSEDAVDSFLGYNMVVIPAGMVLSIILDMMNFNQLHILNVIYTTSILTVIMIVSATLLPDYFYGLGEILFQTLVWIIVVEGNMYFSGNLNFTTTDIIASSVFCLYIGYDWSVAQSEDPTVDNAVDACVALYLDIINLLSRLLSSNSSSRSGRRRRG